MQRNENFKIHYKTYGPIVLHNICGLLNSGDGEILIGPSENYEQQEIVFEKIYDIVVKYFEKYMQFIYLYRTDDYKINVQVQQIRNFGEYAFLKINEESNFWFFQDKKLKSIPRKFESYIDFVIHHRFPIFTSYIPTTIKSSFARYVSYNKLNFYQIGDINNNNLYKYLDLEAALISLEKGNLRFVEPSFWEDQYEGKYYNAIYDNVPNSLSNTPFLRACCFTRKSENEAAWVLYKHQKTGLATRCVKFTVNRIKLYYELVKNAKNMDLYAGVVSYQSKFYIDKLCKNSKNSDYHRYFDNFNLAMYLNLLLLKRSAYEHEQEVRIFSIPNEINEKSVRGKDGKLIEKSKPDDIEIDWLNIIEKVEVDETCSEYEKKLLRNKFDEIIKAKKLDESSDEYLNLKRKTEIIPTNIYKDDSLKDGRVVIDAP